MNKYNLEWLKEGLRVIQIAAYPLVITWAIAIFSVPADQLMNVLKSPITYIGLVQLVALAILKGLDKKRNKIGRDTGDPLLTKGLSGY
jgi:hypothetical protein